MIPDGQPMFEVGEGFVPSMLPCACEPKVHKQCTLLRHFTRFCTIQRDRKRDMRGTNNQRESRIAVDETPVARGIVMVGVEGLEPPAPAL